MSINDYRTRNYSTRMKSDSPLTPEQLYKNFVNASSKAEHKGTDK